MSTFTLPENLKALEKLAYNLWFSWNPDARDIFRSIDLQLWREKGRNPVAFLRNVDSKILEEKAADPAFVEKVDKVYKRFTDYMGSAKTRFNESHPNLSDQLIAYFSAEYGLHESLPNYAGGLGILAGDHCKTASDLGLPFVAVGLMYKHAYFTQYINENGEQLEEFKELVHEELPIELVKTKDDKPLLVSVPLLDHDVYLQIWQVNVGRIKLFLLDTGVDKNATEDQEIIHSLYGGSRDTRMKQEIILGIGGLRALRKMNLNPTVFHMNEGHSAFLGLERLYELMNEGMDFKPALEFVRSTTLFTTHTPIPAGNEAFEFDMMERYFKNMWPQLEMSDDFFFDLGRNVNEHQHENFSLTILALNLSYMANGVSKLHSKVSREMWSVVYPGVPTSEVPIQHVTNGIHTESWLHREMIRLFDEYLGSDWRGHLHEQSYWEKVFAIPDEVWWKAMQKMKQDMSQHLRRRYSEQLDRYASKRSGFPPPDSILDENGLMIGFARRFAPYKRANLIFKDKKRIAKILNDPERPVQIVFSGKAHPQNEAGKELIREINQIAQKDAFAGKVTFIEDYGINVARSLVSGVDLWLNNPRRPLEASGTSGQKVPINGGINFSVLDGWWPEGYNGKNGWTIGRELEYSDHAMQDEEDAHSLYETLEEIVNIYYDRDKDGIPREWIRISKESLRTVISAFSTHTMVWNYTTQFYVPGMHRHIRYTENEYTQLFRFTRWMNRVKRHWKNVHLALGRNGNGEDRRIFGAGESKEISILVRLGSLKAEELRVELILERQDAIKKHQDMEVYPMGLIGQAEDNTYEYRARVKAKEDGSYRFNCRVMPIHHDMFNGHETRLIKWLD